MPLKPPVHRPAGYRPQSSEERHAAYERLTRRGSASSRGYTSRWRRVRDEYLARHPLCEMCAREQRVTVATEVHHTVPVREDRSRMHDATLLIATCHACHMREEARLRRDK